MELGHDESGYRSFHYLSQTMNLPSHAQIPCSDHITAHLQSILLFDFGNAFYHRVMISMILVSLEFLLRHVFLFLFRTLRWTRFVWLCWNCFVSSSQFFCHPGHFPGILLPSTSSLSLFCSWLYHSITMHFPKGFLYQLKGAIECSFASSWGTWSRPITHTSVPSFFYWKAAQSRGFAHRGEERS